MNIKLITPILFLLFVSPALSACPNDKMCAQCTGTKCETCYKSFPDSSGVCTKPSPEVENCISYANNTTCIFCAFGYVQVGSKCEKIAISGCTFANPSDKNQCVSCEDSKLPSSDGKCNGDSKCADSNCENCLGTACLVCKSGYAVNKSTKCVKEPSENCAETATDETKCETCMPGYYDSDGKCLSDGSGGSGNGGNGSDESSGRVFVGVVVALWAVFSF